MAIEYGVKNSYNRYGVPSLDLTFASKKSLVDRISGNNLITFTRAQSGNEATYVGADGLIKTAAANEPRFDHNPATLESLGLLVEEARTNLRTASTDFSTGWIYNINVTVASGQTSPTGDTSASLITLNAGTFAAKLAEKFVSDISIVYTRSWFVKKTNQRYIWCGDQNNGVYAPNYRFDLDLSTGNVVSGSSFNSGFSITAYANGYYRISVTCVSQDTFNISANNTTSINPLTTSTTHDGTETFIIWGYQVEQGAFPTSYIPTSGSTVTRAADVASITGSNFSSWYNSTEGTLFQNCISRTPTGGTTGGTGIGAYLTSSSTDAQIGFARWTTEVTIYVYGSSTYYAQFVFASQWAQNTTSKAIVAYKLNDFAASANGLTLQTDTSGVVPIATELGIGQMTTAAYNRIGAGTFSRIAYYPTRLPDATLQALTQ